MHSSEEIIGVIKLRKIKWSGYTAGLGEVKTCRKPEGRHQFGGQRVGALSPCLIDRRMRIGFIWRRTGTDGGPL